MKKLTSILLFIFVLAYSCKKGDPSYPPPVIHFITDEGYLYSDTTLQLGASFKIGIQAQNPNVNLTNFIIRVESDVMETYLDSGMNTAVLNYQNTFTKGIKDSETWRFIIRDKDGKEANVSLVITKDNSSQYGDIIYYPSTTFGAQNNISGSFFSLSNDMIYTQVEAFNNQDRIDLCYYYDLIVTDGNTLASPGANIDDSVFPGPTGLSNWTVRRTTRFKKTDLTAEDFMDASNDSLLIAAYGQSEGKRKAKNLLNGHIFSFKNEDGKIGLFKVNSVVGADEGTINISVKVQN